jgi:hypothetical protein
MCMIMMMMMMMMAPIQCTSHPEIQDFRRTSHIRFHSTLRTDYIRRLRRVSMLILEYESRETRTPLGSTDVVFLSLYRALSFLSSLPRQISRVYIPEHASP